MSGNRSEFLICVCGHAKYWHRSGGCHVVACLNSDQPCLAFVEGREFDQSARPASEHSGRLGCRPGRPLGHGPEY